MVFAFNAYSQQLKSKEQKLPADYLKKSKRQLKTGIILLGSGAVMFAGGSYVMEHGSCSCKSATGPLLMLGGMGMAATSIPFFISSAGNKRKAKLYMKKEALLLTPDIKTRNVYNSIGVKISI